jgi:signal transduction histidine kinase/CHASE3 domain sensor protein
MRGLSARMGLASAALAVLLAAVLLILILAIRAQRDASLEARDAQFVIAAVTNLKVSLLDLEDGQRGYVITGRSAFLAPWKVARRRLPGQERRLRELSVGRHPEQALAGDIIARLNSYLTDYSEKVVASVRTNRTAAFSLIVSGNGKQRVDELRSRFDSLTAREDTRARHRRAAAAHRANQALVLGAGGLVLSVAMVLLFALYLRRSVVLPIGRVTLAARGLAAGHLAARVPPSGGGEVGDLGRSFNAMASSLQSQRERLEEQRSELESSVRRLEQERARMASYVAFGRRIAEPGELTRLGSVMLAELSEQAGADRAALFGFGPDEGEDAPVLLARLGLPQPPQFPASAVAPALTRDGTSRLPAPVIGDPNGATGEDLVLPLRQAGATVGFAVFAHSGGPLSAAAAVALEDLAPQTAATLSSALALQRARRDAALVRAVFDATPDAIALLDGTGHTVIENPPMKAVRSALVASVRSAGGGIRTNVDDVGATGSGEVRDELQLRGAGRTFARYAAPVSRAGGAEVGRLVVLREITKEREADRLKDEFFTLVSHELRTPLTSILGYLELVLDDEDAAVGAEPRRYLEVVQRNATRLLRLVGDLLFVAQVEAGQLALNRGTVDLERVAAEAAEAAQPPAEARSVTVTCDLEPVALESADRDRLGQVLDNLIANAIKFTPEGGAVILRLREEGPDAVLEVTDDGPGIPVEEQAHLFDRFYRAASATRQAVQGVGLGLTIVKAICEAHGGRVTVHSAEGAGTTFRVELPIQAGAAQAEPVPAARDDGAPGGR